MKLFASDIDNTLIPQKEEPDKGEIEKLKNYLDEIGDVKIAYVSGRNLELVQEVLSDHCLPLPDFVATDVGTLIYTFDGEDWKKDPEYRDHLALTGYDKKEIEEKLKGIKGLELQEESAQTEFKLSYYLDLDRKKESLPQIRETVERGPAQLIYSEDRVKQVGLVDIIPEAGGKSGAVDFLAQKLEAEKEEVIYAGDSGNDLDALSAGFNGILVGNAPEELKKELSVYPNVYIAENEFIQGVIEGLKHFWE